MRLDAQEKIQRVAGQMLVSQPWFASLFLRLHRREFYEIEVAMSGMPTMAVNGTELLYDPDFVMSLSDSDLMAILLHEVGHIALFHCYRGISFDDQQQWNIACDRAVNALLEDCGVFLPSDCVPAGPLDKTAEELFDDNETKKISKEFKGSRQDVLKAKQNEDGSVDLQDSEGNCVHKMSEQDWKEAMASARGIEPGSMRRHVDAALQEVEDWRSVLQRFVIAKVKSAEHTWTRHSRRLTNTPGWRREPQIGIAVTVDTSGSIHGPMLTEFVSEVNSIASLIGIRMWLLGCDAEVHDVIEPGEPVPTEWGGGGGTNFCPAFTKVDALIRDGERIEAMIFLTDGHGSFPAQEPAYDTLWVTKQRFDAPFGEVLVLKEGS